MRSALEQNGIEVMIPQYTKGWIKNDGSANRAFENVLKYTINDLTLIEKNRYPLSVIVKKYEVFLDKEGKETVPFLGLGNFSFEGILKLRTEVMIEIVNSKNNELIDKIKIYKTYRSNQVKFDYSSIDDLIFNGAIDSGNAATLLFDSFFDDIIKSITNYDYKMALSYAK